MEDNHIILEMDDNLTSFGNGRQTKLLVNERPKSFSMEDHMFVFVNGIRPIVFVNERQLQIFSFA